MMKKTKMKRVPKLRFPEFTDDWEQRKAVDIADYSKGNGYSKGDLTDFGIPIILYGRLYTKYQFAISEVDTFALPRNGAVYSQGNEVIVPASGETAEDIARASAVEKSGVLLGGDLNILRPFDFMNPLFLALAISSGEPQKELAKKAQGKSVVHIHNTDIQEVTIAYPSRTEQERIVSVFRQLDHLITLHQRKLKNLNVLKKCVMQKLFSQKVRFKADDGSEFPKWKEKRLGDVFTERTERSKGGETLLSVTIAQGIVRQSETDKRNTASENKSNYKIVKRNDLAYNTMRMWQGAEGVSEYDGIVSPAYTVITALDGNNSYFFEILFKQTFMLQIFQRYSQGLTSDTWNLKFPAFSEIKCLVPCEDEQNKIVECVKVLDSVIEKQKATLAAWEELKKGLLQQMFV